MRGLGAVFWGVTALGLLALAGSFAGALHPAGDSLAVFRSHIAGAGLIWMALGWGVLGRGGTNDRNPRGVFLGVALVLIAALMPQLYGHVQPERARAEPVTIYQKNMSFRLADTGPLAEDIHAIAPDILTLQEVTRSNLTLLDTVQDMLPYHHFCHFEAVGSVAVAARWPVIEGQKICAHGLAAMRVHSPDGPLWVASMHLHWPWPAGQSAQHADIAETLATLQGPVVLGGDFNMVRWSALMHRTEAAIGARDAGRVRLTLPFLGPFVLPIDHILIPKDRGGATELRPLLGSDHRGLVARY